MRRDMTSSLRACLAAEAWKRLYPDETRGGNQKQKSKIIPLPFDDFAKQSFKVSPAYAKQALAILNNNPDMTENLDIRMAMASCWPCRRRKERMHDKRRFTEMKSASAEGNLMSDGRREKLRLAVMISGRHATSTDQQPCRERGALRKRITLGAGYPNRSNQCRTSPYQNRKASSTWCGGQSVSAARPNKMKSSGRKSLRGTCARLNENGRWRRGGLRDWSASAKTNATRHRATSRKAGACQQGHPRVNRFLPP